MRYGTSGLATQRRLTCIAIVIIDGPSVLGWKLWREMQADGVKEISETIEAGIASGFIRNQPPRRLAQLIVALIEESALLVTYADDHPRQYANLNWRSTLC